MSLLLTNFLSFPKARLLDHTADLSLDRYGEGGIPIYGGRTWISISLWKTIQRLLRSLTGAEIVAQWVELLLAMAASHITALVQVSDALLSTKLPSTAPEKAANYRASAWVPATHLGET